jgi:hypothetical protein
MLEATLAETLADTFDEILAATRAETLEETLEEILVEAAPPHTVFWPTTAADTVDPVVRARSRVELVRCILILLCYQLLRVGLEGDDYTEMMGVWRDSLYTLPDPSSLDIVAENAYGPCRCAILYYTYRNLKAEQRC